jgi:DNA polymerase alpha subunit A
MKSKGGNARAGDVIPYVFCLAEGEETAKTAQADRAKHPDEVRKAGGDLTIGKTTKSYVTNTLENLCVRL